MTVDSHQHFWNYHPERHAWITPDMAAIRRDFTPNDLRPLLEKNKIEYCVTVQVDQTEKETEWLRRIAQEHNFVKGIVGWTDFRSEQAQARLEHYFQFHEIKGFRHIVQAEPEGFLLDSKFCRGIALLEQYNFTYDILVYPNQLHDVLGFVRKFPRQRFVIDHLAKPRIADGLFEPWRKLMAQIGEHENVFCKMSGMVTEAKWTQWKTSDFIPYLDTIFEAFGPGRIMYGSDWPVCLVAASYDGQLDIVKKYIERLSPSEKKSVMGVNAASFYHL